MSKIIVVGSGGQLGQELCTILGDEATGLPHREIELTDGASIRRALEALSPSIVVNTAAFNLVDDSEIRPTEAFAVNAWGVRELSLVCRELDAVLVHFSTDYVFGLDDARSTPYDEDSPPGPLGVYGMSKIAGEYFVRAICPRHFIIRTCGLYGMHGVGGKGRNFVETMLRVGQHGPVRVVNDQVCTPTYAIDVAQAAIQLMHTHDYGLYHWTNHGSCSWHEFACEIFRQSGMNADCSPITSAEFGSRARRPRYSVLATDRYERKGFGKPREWSAALADYLARRSTSPRATS